MPYLVITRDKPDALQLRLDTREAHLAYIADTGVVEMAGPFVNGEGEMTGSLMVLNVDSFDQATDWADNDPYAKAGLFKHSRVEYWNKVIG